MEGTTIGRYVVGPLLSGGGMGEVYTATHKGMGQKAVVKTLLPHLAAIPDVRARFLQEARAAAMVNDQGVVKIFDQGKLSNGIDYIIMEYLEGESLSSRIRREQRLSPWFSLHLVRQAVRSLRTVHGSGIVHRDLKPDNIFLVVDPEPLIGVRAKLIDFGVAKVPGVTRAAVDEVKTGFGAQIGTPPYMPPEQWRDARGVDGRSDLYAMGCVLFEMFTGRIAFPGPAYLDQHEAIERPSISALDSSFAVGLDSLVQRALARNREQRFRDADEFVDALSRALANETRRIGRPHDLDPRGHTVSDPLPGSKTPVVREAGRPTPQIRDDASRQQADGTPRIVETRSATPEIKEGRPSATPAIDEGHFPKPTISASGQEISHAPRTARGDEQGSSAHKTFPRNWAAYAVAVIIGGAIIAVVLLKLRKDAEGSHQDSVVIQLPQDDKGRQRADSAASQSQPLPDSRQHSIDPVPEHREPRQPPVQLPTPGVRAQDPSSTSRISIAAPPATAPKKKEKLGPPAPPLLGILRFRAPGVTGVEEPDAEVHGKGDRTIRLRGLTVRVSWQPSLNGGVEVWLRPEPSAVAIVDGRPLGRSPTISVADTPVSITLDMGSVKRRLVLTFSKNQ